jgi:anion-transporting  ArsA/GET3 family ATPase
MVIGKVRDELMLHKVHGRRRWDALVLDAGATGHALELLRMPAVAAMTFRSGGAHREASNVQAFLRDPSRTRVHVVAKPEELACAEASDLVAQVTGELGMSVGSLVVNACRPAPPARIDDALDALAASADDGPRREVCGDLIDVVAHALGWQRRQASAIERLVARTGVSALELPLLSGPAFGLPELRLLSRRLEEVVR